MLIKHKITNNKKEVLKRSFHQQVEIKKKTKLSELAETKFLFWTPKSLAPEVLALTVYLAALLAPVLFLS